MSLAQDHKHSSFSAKHLLLPYLLAGLIGVPLGSFLLQHVQADTFKWILGLFLILWSPFMLFQPQFNMLKKAGKWADGSIGFIGGILGGLGGFCGAMPSAWLMLKNTAKHEQRYILRHFNFAIQVMTLGFYLWKGQITTQHLPYLAVLLIAVSLPAILGAKLFYKISEQVFKNIILSLLFISGVVLVSTAL